MLDRGPFIVVFDRRVGALDSAREYLVALRYDPYGKGDTYSGPLTLADRREAFVFRTLAAAEVAAVYIGGYVEQALGGKEEA